MGAMLVGMATGIAAMIFAVVLQIIIALGLFIDAHRHKMKAVNWAIAGFIFHFWILPVYIIVRIKTANLKCVSCGKRVGENKDFCPECGTAVQKIDDGAIAKKFVLYVLAALAVFVVLGTVYTVIVTELNP